MPKFRSQTDLSLKKKKKRWTPKGRQSDSLSIQEIKETIGEDLPEGFQRSEFLLKKGFIDNIVSRDKIKTTLSGLFSVFLSSTYE